MFQYTTTTITFRCVERSVASTINRECDRKEGNVTGIRIEREAKDNYLVKVERTFGIFESIIKKLTRNRKG